MYSYINYEMTYLASVLEPANNVVMLPFSAIDPRILKERILDILINKFISSAYSCSSVEVGLIAVVLRLILTYLEKKIVKFC